MPSRHTDVLCTAAAPTLLTHGTASAARVQNTATSPITLQATTTSLPPLSREGGFRLQPNATVDANLPLANLFAGVGAGPLFLWAFADAPSLVSVSHALGSGPDLLLDFVDGAFGPNSFGPLTTFTRGTTATFHDASGALQTAQNDVLRLDHDRGTGVRRGLLLEQSRTNLFLQSGTPATQSINVTAQIYSLSFYGTGSITLSGAHVATLNGTGANARSVLIFTPAAGALTLTVTGDVQLAQLEVGNCDTSYIATTTAAVTRASDVAVLPLGPWWNPVEGTMLVEWQDINQQSGNSRIIGMAGSRTLMSLTSGTGPGGNNATRLEMWNGSVAFQVIPPVADISKGVQRGVAAWSATGRALAIRNTLASSPAPLLNTGSPTELYLGAQAGGSLSINGCLRRITYFARRLPDAELLALVP